MSPLSPSLAPHELIGRGPSPVGAPVSLPGISLSLRGFAVFSSRPSVRNFTGLISVTKFRNVISVSE